MASNVQLPGFHRWRAIQASVGVAAVQLASTGFTDRNAISIKADGGNAGSVFIGHSSAVTSTSGVELRAKEAIDLLLSTRAAVWARASQAAQRVSIVELG